MSAVVFCHRIVSFGEGCVGGWFPSGRTALAGSGLLREQPESNPGAETTALRREQRHSEWH